MEASVFERVHSAEYMRLFLEKGVRPNGRALEEGRRVSVVVGSITTALGSSMVKYGNSTVVAGVTATAIKPQQTRLESAPIEASMELLPVAAPHIRPGRKSEEAHALEDQVLRYLRRNVDTSGFDIEDGELVWSLMVDMYCLDHDGNMQDIAVVAAIAAIQNTRLPDVVAVEDGYAVSGCERSRRITFRELVVPVSLGLLDTSTLLLDPDFAEEKLGSGTITLMVDRNDAIRGIQKSGGHPVGNSVLKGCIDISRRRARTIFEVLEARNAEDPPT